MIGAKPSGSDELNNLISLLADPQKYKQKLDALEKVIADANAKIALVGKANSIEKLHKQAKESAEQAQNEVENARMEAKKLIDSAKQDLTVQKKQISDEKAALEAAKQEWEANHRSQSAWLAEKERENVQEALKLQEQQEALREWAANLAAQEAEIKRKQKILSQL